MCGIHGWIGTFRRDPGLHHGCLAHRGPDEAGEFHDEQGGVRVAFGHRRLRIIDLSPEAAQPMATEAGLAIAYNGEVYNYRALREELEARGTKFRSASDTEVVLRGWEAWGRDVLGRLDGMFAFALWDRPAGELVLARDAVGIKPCTTRRSPRASSSPPRSRRCSRRPASTARSTPTGSPTTSPSATRSAPAPCTGASASCRPLTRSPGVAGR